MRILMCMLVVFFWGGQAVAGDDPCENESGAAYGLCHAYCVAIDCDDPALKKASDKACAKITARYQRLYDEQITCGPDVQVECPCWSQADIYVFEDEWTHGNDDDCYIEDDEVYIQQMNDGMSLFAGPDDEAPVHSCYYYNPPNERLDRGITEEEMNECIGIVQSIIIKCPW